MHALRRGHEKSGPMASVLAAHHGSLATGTPHGAGGSGVLGAAGAATLPVPPRDPKPHGMTPPGRMARPDVRTLNSYAVSVCWTPPADLHSRRARDAACLRRAGGGTGGGDALRQERGPPVIGYRLRYWCRGCSEGQPPVPGPGEVPDFVEMEDTWDSSTCNAVLKWLVSGMAYVFQVHAFNDAGKGPWSDPSECFVMPLRPDGRQPVPATFLPGEVLPGPEHLSPKADSIEVHWPPPCHRGAAIVSYDILCSKDPDFNQCTKELHTTGESTKYVAKDLEPNTVYYFKHRAVNEKGVSKWSDSTPGVATIARPPERPDPPIRLGEPSAWLPQELSVRWEAPESYGVPIQHYRVRCATSPSMDGAWEVPVGAESKGTITLNNLSSEPPSAQPAPVGRRPGFNKGHYALTQLRVRGLRPTTAYYFQVMATNQIGESDWSQPSGAMQTTASPPGRAGRPCFVSGTKLTGMRICWEVPECFGAAIQRYDVRVARQAMMLGAVEHRGVSARPTAPELFRYAPEAEMLEATLAGCWDPAVDHFYQVRAVNAAGSGDWSPSSEAMQVAAERPLRPEAPHSFAALHHVAIVRWHEPECRGSPITGYHLRYSKSRDMVQPVEVQGLYGTVKEFAVTGLHPHGSYFFQLAAENAVGRSDWSPASALVKVRQVPPTKMSAPVLLSRSPSTLTVGFTAPADTGTRDGELIQAYTLSYAPVIADPTAVGDSGTIHKAKPSGMEVGGLRPGTPYIFQVRASNEFGDGELSEAAEFRTTSGPPNAPEAPWMSERTPYSITLAVKVGRDNGAPITHFAVQVRECESGRTWDTRRVEVCRNEDGLQYYAVPGLSHGVVYRFRAFTVNQEGASPLSELSAEDCTTEPVPPELVQNLRAEESQAHSFRLCWERPYHNGDPVTGYRVQWSLDCEFRKSPEELDTEATSAVLDGCAAGQPVFARVAARNLKGLGKYSAALETRMGAHVPLAPLHVQPVGIGPINVRLGWIVPFDCGSPITNFWVRYWETDTDGRPPEKRDRGEVLVTGRKRFCSIEPLFSLREYVYEVAAQNALGIGPYSEASLPMRLGPPETPTVPERLKFVRASTTSLSFSWNTSESMGSDIIEQVVHVSTDPAFAEGSFLTISVPPWSPAREHQAGRLKHRCSSPDKDEMTVAAEKHRTKGRGNRTCMRPPQNVATGRPNSVLSAAEDLTRSFKQEVSIRRKSASCGVPRTVNADDGTAITGTEDVVGTDEQAEESAPEMQTAVVQVAESFDDIFPLSDGAAILQRASAHYQRPEMTGEYLLPGLHAGTHYYVRVATRNVVGLSPFCKPSKRVATKLSTPSPLGDDLVLLREGCTSFTLGWRRPDCQGAPITHYVVRCAATDEVLDSGDCAEFELQELERETWPGIIQPLPQLLPFCIQDTPNLDDRASVVAFAEYLMQRFETLQESWEWLDVNGNGEISWEEFLYGDEQDIGPPFADFPGGQEELKHVWKLLDADAGGAIGINEYDRLRPYFKAVREGSAGLDFKGVYCLVPSLLPGTGYHVMVRAVNEVGMSEWTKCPGNPLTTTTMTPASMRAVAAARELRTTSSITLRWELPYDNGDPLSKLELRYVTREVDEGVPDRAVLRVGELLELFPGPSDPGCPGGRSLLPTSYTMKGLKPGQAVFAIARAWNGRGAARMWSDTPGPAEVAPPEKAQDCGHWDISTLPAPPTVVITPPVFEVESLRSCAGTSQAEFSFQAGRNNGRPYTAFCFQLLHDKDGVEREWETPSSPGETTESRQTKLLRPIRDLLPGNVYALRVRAINSLGASSWSEAGPWQRMPPDVPGECPAPLSEFVSLTWVELKWTPPPDNGEPITTYGIKTCKREDAEDREWRHLTEEEVRDTLRAFKGTSSRRNTDKQAWVAKVNHLESNYRHYFRVRACNAVGWGAWSEASWFVTKPARPGKVCGVACAHAGIDKIGINWEEPELNGLEAQRYELSCGSSLPLLRWARLVAGFLCTCPDTDRIFGELNPPKLGAAKGQPAMRELVSEELMFLPMEGSCLTQTVEGLLPAQEYYFAVRVVTRAGRGSFSDIVGPVLTGSAKPCNPLPPQAQPMDDSSCRLLLRMPYDNGLPLQQVLVALSRRFGPLSADEVDAGTGACQEHIARREVVLDPAEMPRLDPPGTAAGASGLVLAGTTRALLRSYQHEGLDVRSMNWDGCEHVRASATSRKAVVTLENLKPGTQYGVQWSCRNEKGWCDFTEPVVRFETETTNPDKPIAMEIHGSL